MRDTYGPPAPSQSNASVIILSSSSSSASSASSSSSSDSVFVLPPAPQHMYSAAPAYGLSPSAAAASSSASPFARLSQPCHDDDDDVSHHNSDVLAANTDDDDSLHDSDVLAANTDDEPPRTDARRSRVDAAGSASHQRPQRDDDSSEASDQLSNAAAHAGGEPDGSFVERPRQRSHSGPRVSVGGALLSVNANQYWVVERSAAGGLFKPLLRSSVAGSDNMRRAADADPFRSLLRLCKGGLSNLANAGPDGQARSVLRDTCGHPSCRATRARIVLARDKTVLVRCVAS
jgi:hypothetical protein